MGNLTLKKHKIFTPSGSNTSGGGLSSVVAGTNISIDNTDPLNPIINTTADDIIVVANYSTLPPVATVTGKFYWCSASQGTSWLPGFLGGTYYNSGLYYSNGVTWEFLNVPYNATQAEVNTGTNNDKFVTPSTLKNSVQFQYLDATSSIQTQLNTTYRNVIKDITDGSAITGSTSIVLAKSVLVPANTFTTGDIIKLTARGIRNTATGTFVNYFYVNTSNSLSGATLIGQFSAASAYSSMERDLFVKSSTNSETLNTSTNSSTSELVSSGSAPSSINIDWSQPQYIIHAVQNAAVGNSSYSSGLIVMKK